MNCYFFRCGDKLFERLVVYKERVDYLLKLFDTNFVVIFQKLNVKFVKHFFVLFFICKFKERGNYKLVNVSLGSLCNEVEKTSESYDIFFPIEYTLIVISKLFANELSFQLIKGPFENELLANNLCRLFFILSLFDNNMNKFDEYFVEKEFKRYDRKTPLEDETVKGIVPISGLCMT